MAIIKYLRGGIQQDNTRVSRPIIMLEIPYKLKPNEFYFVDKKTGKKTLIKRKQEAVSSDNRSNYLRKQDLKKTKQILKLLEQDKNYEKGIETINSLTKLALPSTYVGPLFNNNGKSYTDNLISGEGTGNTAGNAAIDLLTPFAVRGINRGILIGNRLYRIRLFSKALDNSSPKLELVPLNIGWGPKLTISVSHASDTGDILLFFPKRWDVVNEGANPHGIWFQGKLGTPRTDFTNPGKGAKAARARALFANRPVLMQGNLTLEKPMITVGDVPNRSLLSYYADNAGADGLIYNGVYDNGYNNNLVILSFKKLAPNVTSEIGSNSFTLTDRTSLKFFEKPTSKLTDLERAGVPKQIKAVSRNKMAREKQKEFNLEQLSEEKKAFLLSMDALGLEFEANIKYPELAHDTEEAFLKPGMGAEIIPKKGSDLSNYLDWMDKNFNIHTPKVAKACPSTSFEEHIVGDYDPVTNIARINTAYPLYSKSTFIHELGSHGTDMLVTDRVIKNYPFKLRYQSVSNFLRANIGKFRPEPTILNIYSNISGIRPGLKNTIKNRFAHRNFKLTHGTNFEYDSNNWYEARATLNEIRAELFKEKSGSWNDFGEVIDLTSDLEIINLIANTNSYGLDYYRAYNLLSPKLKKEWMGRVRHALKYLPVTTPFILLNTDEE